LGELSTLLVVLASQYDHRSPHSRSSDSGQERRESSVFAPCEMGTKFSHCATADQLARSKARGPLGQRSRPTHIPHLTSSRSATVGLRLADVFGAMLG